MKTILFLKTDTDYRTFCEDAKIVSNILNIHLASNAIFLDKSNFKEYKNTLENKGYKLQII